MKLQDRLDANEARLFGVLVEKCLTTPDHYPLTLNAATAGANQKNNRDPVMQLTEGEVRDALARLVVNGLAGRVVPAGSRVEKYRHNGEERLGLDPVKLAILAELVLRGPQTAGELRTRVSRMRPLADLDALQAQIGPLRAQGWVRDVPPAPGSRAPRFAETVSLASEDTPSAPAPAEPAPHAPVPAAAPALDERVRALEDEVRSLRASLEDLANRLGETL